MEPKQKTAEYYFDKDFYSFMNFYKNNKEELNFSKNKLIKKTINYFKSSNPKADSLSFEHPLDRVTHARDFLKYLDAFDEVIKLGSTALRRGWLNSAGSVFQDIEYVPGLKKLINCYIKKKNAAGAGRILAWSRYKGLLPHSDDLRDKIIKIGKQTKEIDLPAFFQMGKPKEWEGIMEEKAKELLRIGEPFAFRIFEDIYTKEQIWEIGDNLLRSGRINDALYAYSTSGIDVSQIDQEKTTEEIISDIAKVKIAKKV